MHPATVFSFTVHVQVMIPSTTADGAIPSIRAHAITPVRPVHAYRPYSYRPYRRNGEMKWVVVMGDGEDDDGGKSISHTHSSLSLAHGHTRPHTRASWPVTPSPLVALLFGHSTISTTVTTRKGPSAGA
ncbi:uncharacterized protein K489DRAFT_366726 [Dissoconium aciculare CBS 342.82]|uniref:Uncharacterized protein n=1 Tax=Dissoconium aciculare CBS 342.82 TaxID=1314786 RepID=A0A6J3MKV0_9PEZI|nr:uncharacterized protein K489DRAFT_366726 [Dissoconium aciculare CBS 342.82]KAF1827597.1 hypothetical protein K489DRAFT_366726 [Dissoconium aciculare CBS 342.82]